MSESGDAPQKVLMQHPITGARKWMNPDSLDERKKTGWLDMTPLQRTPPRSPQEAAADAQHVAEAQQRASRPATAADPDAAGVLEEGPSE